MHFSRSTILYEQINRASGALVAAKNGGHVATCWPGRRDRPAQDRRAGAAARGRGFRRFVPHIGRRERAAHKAGHEKMGQNG
jgi:hypothetical protein